MRLARARGMEKAAGASWIAVLFCLLAQVLTELTMRTPYSPLRDAVSDLGYTACTVRICSPLYRLMDASFVLLGLSLAIGGWLSHLSAPRLCRVSRVATIALSVGGLGMAVVGLFPENVNLPVHIAGAVVGLAGGNVGAAFAGWALLHVRGHRHTGWSAIVVGAVGVAGSGLSVLVFFGEIPGLISVGGGLERLGVEPLLVIMALSGGALLLGEDVLAVALGRVGAARAHREATTSVTSRRSPRRGRSSTSNPWRRSSSATSGSRKVR